VWCQCLPCFGRCAQSSPSVLLYAVLWSMDAILAFTVLLCTQCLHASEPCPIQQMRTVLTADADRKDGDLIVFRGEVSSLPEKEHTRFLVRQVFPARYVYYAVDEVLWGSLKNATVRTPYANGRACGLPTVTMNEKVFAVCWASRTACGSPVPATDENSKKIRELVRRARLRQRKVSVPPERAEARVLHKVKPAYSDTAKLTRTQGDVVLQIVINARGRVIDARVLSGSPLVDVRRDQCSATMALQSVLFGRNTGQS